MNCAMDLMTAAIITITLTMAFPMLVPVLTKLEEKETHASFDNSTADRAAAA